METQGPRETETGNELSVPKFKFTGLFISHILTICAYVSTLEVVWNSNSWLKAALKCDSSHLLEEKLLHWACIHLPSHVHSGSCMPCHGQALLAIIFCRGVLSFMTTFHAAVFSFRGQMRLYCCPHSMVQSRFPRDFIVLVDQIDWGLRGGRVMRATSCWAPECPRRLRFSKNHPTYRVSHLLAVLGWINIDLVAPPSCLAAKQIVPMSHYPRQDRVDSRTIKI